MAEVEHRDVRARGADQIHVVVDEDRQRPGASRDLLDHLAERRRLLVGQSGARFVEQHQSRFADDGAGDLDEPSLGGAELADRP